MAIVTCTCSHEYQDKLYGLHQRVANYARKGNGGNPGVRCTVCSKMHPATQTEKQDNATKGGKKRGQ